MRPAILRTLYPAAVLVFLGCKSSEPALRPLVGDFQVDLAEGGLTVSRASDPTAVLLRSYLGAAPYSPVAVRESEATWEMQYGAWKITDAPVPWTGGTSLRADGDTSTWLDGAGNPVATLTVTSPDQGVLLLDVKSARPRDNRVSLAFACEATDHFLGFGAQADAVDHHGHEVPIWTSEPGVGKSESDDPPELWFLEGARHASSAGLPTWLSNRGFVGVVDSDRRSIFELCSVHEDAWRVETWGDELKLYLYDGPTPAQALERATTGVLGRPMRPPPLAFAPWNDAIYGSAKVREVAALLRSRGIPSSVIWTEDFRGGEQSAMGYRLKEEWELDRTLYPDAEAVASELRGNGFAWMAYFNTFLVSDARVYGEAVAGGHTIHAATGQPYLFDGATFKPTSLADLSREQTREWVKGYLRRALDLGFDGWMADFGEWLPHDAVLASGEDPQSEHNRYPDEWTKLNAEALAERDDGRQRLFFARSGWLGSTRHVPVWWAGDQRTDFQKDDGLPTVVPLGLGMGLAGMSTFGSDIGGYQSATNPPATKELYFRWTTLGALSPVMRTHHGTKPAEQWWFGKDEETLQHFKRWADFHIRLFPYLDGCAAEAERTGMPMMRALALEFPEDEAGWTLSDEYMLGPALLVAPVIVEGAVSRKVHFPPGAWTPFAGGATVTGPTDLEVHAELGELPLFLRGGRPVPMLRAGVQTLLPAAPPVVDLRTADASREIHLAPGSGTFQEREGAGYIAVGCAQTACTGAPYSQGGALPECVSSSQRGCVEPASGGTVRVRLDQRSELDFAGNAFVPWGYAREMDLVVHQ